MHNIRANISYLAMILAAALLGLLLSFAAQGGGIGQVNGFIAPIMGPWSRILAPNADRFVNWESSNYIFAISTTLITTASVVLSSVPKRKVIRILLSLTAHVAVAFWCLCGLGKVVLELS